MSGYSTRPALASVASIAARATEGLGCSSITSYRDNWHLITPSAAHPATILAVTRERWAQIGITLQFLIVVRTLGEIFRLRHIPGTSFSVAVAMPCIGGALIAACSCWVGVTLYFFRRYTLTAWIAIATVLVLLGYKISVIGR